MTRVKNGTGIGGAHIHTNTNTQQHVDKIVRSKVRFWAMCQCKETESHRFIWARVSVVGGGGGGSAGGVHDGDQNEYEMYIDSWIL